MLDSICHKRTLLEGPKGVARPLLLGSYQHGRHVCTPTEAVSEEDLERGTRARFLQLSARDMFLHGGRVGSHKGRSQCVYFRKVCITGKCVYYSFL